MTHTNTHRQEQASVSEDLSVPYFCMTGHHVGNMWAPSQQATEPPARERTGLGQTQKH